jgi:hypothetical protein
MVHDASVQQYPVLPEVDQLNAASEAGHLEVVQDSGRPSHLMIVDESCGDGMGQSILPLVNYNL